MNYRQLKPNPARGNPGDPSYDPTVDEALQGDMAAKQAKAAEAINKYQEARDALRQRPAGQGGGLQPPSPAPPAPNGPQGCPPNCGSAGSGSANDGQVSGQSKSVSGAVSVSNLLSGK